MFDGSIGLRERFILARLGQENRFGRSDIETWLDREAQTLTPDCDHSVSAPDKGCLWCRVNRQHIIVLEDMQAAIDILVVTTSDIDVCAHTPRLLSWERNVPILASDDVRIRHHIGRDRFIVRIFRDTCFIIHLDGDLRGVDQGML